MIKLNPALRKQTKILANVIQDFFVTIRLAFKKKIAQKTWSSGEIQIATVMMKIWRQSVAVI